MASLAHQHPPSPAVVAAATATNGGGRARQIVAVRRRPCRPTAALAIPSTSVLQPCRPLPISVRRPPSPAVVAAATATDGGGRTRQIVTIHRRPRRPVNLIAAMAFRYSSPFSSWRWRHLRRNPYRRKKRQKKSIFFYGTTFKKTNLAEIFSEARSGTIAHKNKKKNYGRHPLR